MYMVLRLIGILNTGIIFLITYITCTIYFQYWLYTYYIVVKEEECLFNLMIHPGQLNMVLGQLLILVLTIGRPSSYLLKLCKIELHKRKIS